MSRSPLPVDTRSQGTDWLQAVTRTRRLQRAQLGVMLLTGLLAVTLTAFFGQRIAAEGSAGEREAAVQSGLVSIREAIQQEETSFWQYRLSGRGDLPAGLLDRMTALNEQSWSLVQSGDAGGTPAQRQAVDRVRALHGPMTSVIALGRLIPRGAIVPGDLEANTFKIIREYEGAIHLWSRANEKVQSASRRTTSAIANRLVMILGALVTALLGVGILVWKRLERSRGRIMDAVRDSEGRFRTVVQNSSDLVVVVNASGTITYASPSTGRALGLRAHDLAGMEFSDLVDPTDGDRVRETLARGEVTSSRVWRMQHRDGRTVHVEATGADLRDDTNVNGVVLTMRDVTEREAIQSELSRRAFSDALTGLANRAGFETAVADALADCADAHGSLSLLLVDLDDFKTINDSLGKEAGDRLLRAVASRLSNCLGPDDLSARFGGDEFALMLRGTPDEMAALVQAERLVSLFDAPFSVDQREIVVHASIGISLAVPGSDHPEPSIRNAEMALHAAKQSRTSRWELFDPAMHRAVRSRLDMKDDLRRALERGQFVLHYQPIMGLTPERIVGVEALLRWMHPERGLVPPDEFIPLAEETGLIVPIGRWVIMEACRQAAVWHTQFAAAGPISMSVNVSARQLERPGLIDEVANALADSGIPPNSLILELTESALIHDADMAVARLNGLKALGVRLAIDDFGTGYSSLAYLGSLPVDVVKIDRSFIADLPGDSRRSDLSAAMVRLGGMLGLRTVAEGVEDIEQLADLRDLGCDFAQGFYFARPLDPASLAALLAVSGESVEIPGQASLT